MVSTVIKNKPDIIWGGKLFSKLFMRIMFRSVQGWKKRVPDRVSYFIETGCDGSHLEGAVRLSETDASKGVVLLCHPFLKYGMHYFFNNKLDSKLADQGYHVVSFNFKGFGNSNIKGHAFSDDVLSISDFIKNKFPGMPIHLLGCSFGGFHLSHALAQDSSPFSSVVLDSVPCSIDAFFSKGILGTAMCWLSSSRLAEPTGTNPIGASLQKVNGLSISFIYGDQDKYIPEHDVDSLKEKCSEIKFIQFKDCGHLDNYKKHKKDYIDTVVKCFNDSAVANN